MNDASSTVDDDPTSPPLAAPRVLIVEDDRSEARALRVALKRAGFAVTTVVSGEAALTWLTKRRPAAVVTDLGLPGMDGRALARALRALPGFDAVRIAVYTGAVLGADEEAALRPQVDLVVQKGAHSPTQLAERLKGIVHGDA